MQILTLASLASCFIKCISNSPDPSLKRAGDGEEQVDDDADRLFRRDPNKLMSIVKAQHIRLKSLTHTSFEIKKLALDCLTIYHLLHIVLINTANILCFGRFQHVI